MVENGLKLCNIKYAIRSRFSLITLRRISGAWEAFLSLSKATYLRVSSKVTKLKLNLGWPFSLIFLLMEMILWWCLYFSATANAGFYTKIRVEHGFFPWDIEILNNIDEVVIQSISYICVWARISPFSVRFIISLTFILSEKSGLTDSQTFLLLVISFDKSFYQTFIFLPI